MSTSSGAKKPEDKELQALLDERDLREAAQSRIFFLRRFMMVFDPRPGPNHGAVNFDLYDFQESAGEEIYQAIKQGYDLFIEKSRDMGISWLVLGVLLWCWLEEDAFQALLGSYIEDLVDSGDDLDTLFGKLVFFIDNIKDPRMLPPGFNIDKHRTYMRLLNPANGNAIVGKAPTKKFGRAGRYTVVVFDELGFWQHAKQAWSAAGEATRCRIAITTPPDEPSFAKYLRFSGLVKVLTYLWRLHPDKDDAWYEAQKGRKTEEEMLHEIDISWEYSAAARPYPEADRLPFGDHPYIPGQPIYCSIDLGLDAVALEWYQRVPNTEWWTLVEAFEKSDEMIDWFFPIWGRPFSPDFTYTDAELAFIDKVKYWANKTTFFGDPSGKQRHVESKESPYAKMQRQGLIVHVNERDNDWLSRRDATKAFLRNLQINDTPGTRYATEMWKLAKFPKRGEESQATSPIVKPVHDFTSHHRTSLEFMSVNYKTFMHLPQQDHLGGRGRARVYDPKTGRLLS